MNTLAYLLYLLITYLVTVHVGLIFFRNGRVYILGMLRGNEHLTDSINRILLAGYYLLNLGYAALMIRSWQTIYTLQEVFSTVAIRTGKIMLLLALIHFCNMAAILLFSTRRNHFSHHKTNSI